MDQKKIIFVCYLPLIEKLEKDFYMAELLEAGFHVEYWDISQIYFSHIKFVHVIERKYVRKFLKFGELKDALAHESASAPVFIPLITYSGKVIRLFKTFTDFNCFLVLFSRGLMPSPAERKPLITRIIRKLMFLSKPRNFYYFILDLWAIHIKRVIKIKDFDMAFAAGSVPREVCRHISNVIPINYLDYDSHLLLKDNPGRLIEYNYSVFLDDNLVQDPDYKMLHIKTPTPDLYYSSLTKFFDHIESKLNIKVVIAAHPKSNYKEGTFGKRAIYRNKTNELVKDCSFTITHFSTAASYAVAYNKPIIFAYTDEIKSRPYFLTIKQFANTLHCPLYNIDSQDIYDINSLPKFDQSYYNSYKYMYLTSPETENRLTKDIVIEYFKRLSITPEPR